MASVAPELRFTGFIDEWQEGTLGELFDVRDGTHESPQYVVSGKPLITSKNLKPDGSLDLANVSYISLTDFESINKRSMVDVGDILFGMIGTIGNPVRVLSDDFAIKNVALIKERGLPTTYLIQYLRSPAITKQFHQANSGGTQKFIALSDIRSLNIRFPSEIELNKIAEFLAAVDEKVTIVEKRYELLKQYKKVISTRIFDQQLQFRDEMGAQHPRWVYKRVSDLYQFLRSNSLSREGLSSSGTYRNIHYGDIHKRFSQHLNTTATHIPYVAVASEELIGRHIANDILQEGDILIADASEDYVDIGKSLEIVKTTGDTIAGLHTIAMRPLVDFAPGFGGHLFNSIPVHKQIVKLATGVSVLGISMSNISSVQVGIPTLDEQRKIVQVLSTIDDMIEAERARLATAKQWKSGLLRKMLI